MKFASLEHFGIAVWRIALVGVSFASLAWLATDMLVGGVLAQARGAALFVVAALAFYVVVSTPRRLMDRQRVSQAKEAVLLSAASKACLRVTGSRARTILTLRPRDAGLSKAVDDAARRVLLGTKVETAIGEAAGDLASYSASAELRSLAKLRSTAYDAGDEETRGLESSAQLARETKVPIFMTACFFAPIMLLLYSLFSGSTGTGSLAELCSLEFIVIDLAFYLSSAERVPAEL